MQFISILTNGDIFYLYTPFSDIRYLKNTFNSPKAWDNVTNPRNTHSEAILERIYQIHVGSILKHVRK